jgi:hypothetical protein
VEASEQIAAIMTAMGDFEPPLRSDPRVCLASNSVKDATAAPLQQKDHASKYAVAGFERDVVHIDECEYESPACTSPAPACRTVSAQCTTADSWHDLKLNQNKVVCENDANM